MEAAEKNTDIKSTEKEAVKTTAVGGSGDILLCPDGIYRWYYEFPMLKNPTILMTVLKILLLASLFPGLIVFLSCLSDGIKEAFIAFYKGFILVFGILFVLSCIAYLILSAMYGFKYIVLFEMDENGISHAQQDKQFKKAQALSWLEVMTGAAAGNPAVAGAGLLTATRQSMTSEFKNVEKVIGLRKNHTIKVNQLLAKNQIYVKDEDYDFVWEYITSRCKKAKIRK